jgi:hypothetical protein
VTVHTAISIKVVPEQSGKVEYERERLLGIAKKSLIKKTIRSRLLQTTLKGNLFSIFYPIHINRPNLTSGYIADRMLRNGRLMYEREHIGWDSLRLISTVAFFIRTYTHVEL